MLTRPVRKNLGHQFAPATKNNIIRLLVLGFANIYHSLNYGCLEIRKKISEPRVSLFKLGFCVA